MVFRPNLPPREVQRLTMACGLAAATAVEQQTGLTVALKWPNDLLIGDAKVGGILTEIEVKGRHLDYAVVGLGLNVNIDPAELPDDLLLRATSLSHALGRSVARLPLLLAFLQAVEDRYCSLRAGHSPHQEWAERLATLGQPVTVLTSGAVIEGLAEAVDDRGALLVRQPDGHLVAVMAGDVSPQFGKR
jgi:BirA family biotin operon repressor/biotin-[acetyl-CoA-carboxylase] ligase